MNLQKLAGKRTPDSDAEPIGDFTSSVAGFSAGREDVHTWFDLLDLDDHRPFGGKAWVAFAQTHRP